MQRVIGIGETVLDIIFKNGQPLRAVPGGSVFNGIIALGRSGVDATFISEAGNDRIGKWVIRFLEENGVDSANICVYPGSKSPLSLAFLDDNNNAEYIFYKDHPHDQLDFVYPEVRKDDVVMFGSYYALNPVIRPQVAGFLDYAKSKGAILYYDVNFRASHKDEVMKLTPNILENLEYANIVRGSKEDFQIMFNKDDADSVYRSEIAFYTKNFIYTQGADPVILMAEGGIEKQYTIIETDPLSTIGAGDNFNAGLVYGIIKNGITKDSIANGLKEEQWDSIIGCAQRFSAQCCTSIDNYIDKEFGSKMAVQLEESIRKQQEKE